MQTTQEYTYIQTQILQVVKHVTHTHQGEHQRSYILSHTKRSGHVQNGRRNRSYELKK